MSNRGGTTRGRRRLFIFASLLGIIACAVIVQQGEVGPILGAAAMKMQMP